MAHWNVNQGNEETTILYTNTDTGQQHVTEVDAECPDEIVLSWILLQGGANVGDLIFVDGQPNLVLGRRDE